MGTSLTRFSHSLIFSIYLCNCTMYSSLFIFMGNLIFICALCNCCLHRCISLYYQMLFCSLKLFRPGQFYKLNTVTCAIYCMNSSNCLQQVFLKSTHVSCSPMIAMFKTDPYTRLTLNIKGMFGMTKKSQQGFFFLQVLKWFDTVYIMLPVY